MAIEAIYRIRSCRGGLEQRLRFLPAGRGADALTYLLSGFCLLLAAYAPLTMGQEAPGQEAPGQQAPGQEESVTSEPAESSAAAESPTASTEGDATDSSTTATAPSIVPGEAFVNANAAYETGNFAEAIDLYQQLQDAGIESGHLYYNLGNAYLRNGELGQAIASYRRSLIFQPRDQDVLANLEFARKSAKDALAPPAPSAVSKTLFFWHYSLSRSELGTLVVVLNLLLWAVLILRIYRRSSEVLRWIFISLLLLLLTTGTSLAMRHLKPEQVAVIIPQQVDVRSGTNPTAVVLFKLHAGTEVRVVDRREQALRIALPEAGRGGWIEALHAELVVE